MEPMLEKTIQTPLGERELAVYCEDITKMDGHIDVLGISCFFHNYVKTPTSLVGALWNELNIDVEKEAQNPSIDLRDFGNVWLSNPLKTKSSIDRFAVMEMSGYGSWLDDESGRSESVLSVIHTFFKMLELAGDHGVRIKTIAIPIVGTGNQGMDLDLIGIPLINECLRFLRECRAAKRIYIIDRTPRKAYRMARILEDSYQVRHRGDIPEMSESYRQSVKPLTNINGLKPHGHKDVFISYSTKDAEVMHQLCDELEAEGVSVWYAPRDIWGEDYASCIVDAIRSAGYFVPLISQNSLGSRHVLNEIDLAFNSLPTENNIRPIILDETPMVPAFYYYLSRLQWKYVTNDSHTELKQFTDRLSQEIHFEK